ncbi:MAG TPA: phospholipase D-like domain-containing protein [Gemmatimonadales bacterium]|nr:phospholipase D-like domain-containing protein [Gemmatimonadales bacterium]
MSSTTWQLLLGALHVSLATVVSSHVVLTKSDVRAAIGWTGLVWLTPVLGSVLYFFLGINRIRRAAGRMRATRTHHTADRLAARSSTAAHAIEVAEPLRQLANLTGRMSVEPLTAGNAVTPLVDGDAAYPAMIAAIDSAKHSIALATYIFDRGAVADQFVAALAAAVARGVEVRVLVDGVGVRYSRPTIVPLLRAGGVTVAQFLPSPVPFAHPYFNMRNHRKLLVVDGIVGFTGGLNIRDLCLTTSPSPHMTRDVHFRFEGPVVRHLLEAFVVDWRFTTREVLGGPSWFPVLEPVADVVARGIADGPDETQDALLMTLLGALAVAREHVVIVTPYFLPEPVLLEALRVTALRGVDVVVMVPERGNLRLVQWAQQAVLAQVLGKGCRVVLTRAPFDHTKLMVVDGAWSLVGSANWDPRSLRLNFEFVVECYSTRVASDLLGIIAEKSVGAHEQRQTDLIGRALLPRLRDGAAWLLQPYL